MLHPDAPLFAHDRLGGFWNEQTLAKTFKMIRNIAGLPANLQMQDFRRTAATEAAAAGATVDEIRALQWHSTRTAALHYVHPRRAVRGIRPGEAACPANEKRSKVRMKFGQVSEFPTELWPRG